MDINNSGKKNRFGVDWSRAQGTHFWSRPFMDRRMFFRHLASGVAGYGLITGRPLHAAQGGATVKGTARNVIFVFMNGGPSHSDTFDLKEGAWTVPAMMPTSYGDIRWPQGLFPRLAEQIDSISTIRAMRSWVLVHGIGQTWAQIGRNPLSGLSKIAPHIGSVVSRELGEMGPNKPMPAFVNLNTGSGPGQGYLEPEHSPFYVSPNGGGLGLTTNPMGQPAFERRYAGLLELDAEVRTNQEIGSAVGEMERFSLTARSLMYNPTVDRIFTFDAAERLRYGNTGFGNACIAARNLLRNDLGTRFIQINIGGWDNHTNIYGGALNPANANSLGRQFDSGLGTLIADLKSDGLLDKTLIVALGEFGRTVGNLNSQNGRDHFLTMSALIAGGGTAGRRAIGKTDAIANQITEPGWSEQREVRVEDIEATIYSALGIDYTKHYTDDPLGRGFYLIPNNQGIEYKPLHELW